MKKILFLSIILALLIGSVVLAQEAQNGTTSAEQELEQDQEISANDLEVSDPLLLPSSKLYFLKNWTRSIRNMFAFSSVKKAEVKLKTASEKLLELKKMIEKGKRPEELNEAIENFENAIEELKDKVEEIKETASQNPDVAKFTDKFLQHQLLHQTILEKLEEQVPEEAFQKIEQARERHLERFGEVMEKLEEKNKLQERIENNLENMEGSPFKYFQQLLLLEKFEEKASSTLKQVLKQVREKHLERLRQRIEAMPDEMQNKLEQYMERIRGSVESKLEIMRSLKEQVGNEIRNRLDEAGKGILNRERKEAEQRGANCPPDNMIDPTSCQGKIELREDANGCPVPTCVGQGPSFCTALWNPVCGKDNMTYSNECQAGLAGAEVDYQGVCEGSIQNNEPGPQGPGATQKGR